MKFKFSLLAALLASAFLVLVSIVQAPWSTLGTGYAITSNYHGIDIPPGTPVTITAGTLDHSITQVTFRWHFPNGTAAWTDTVVPVYSNGTQGTWNNGTVKDILYAQDTQIPTVMGDWGVQAFFQDATGRTKSDVDDVVAIKATSFNVIPEIALIGTAGAAIAMLLGFGLFAKSRKK
jgi:hypothetical protein